MSQGRRYQAIVEAGYALESGVAKAVPGTRSPFDIASFAPKVSSLVMPEFVYFEVARKILRS